METDLRLKEQEIIKLSEENVNLKDNLDEINMNVEYLKNENEVSLYLSQINRIVLIIKKFSINISKEDVVYSIYFI